MSSFSLLVTDFQSLAAETRRKYPEVREATDKSVNILKSAPEQSISTLSADNVQSQELLKPVFLGCATRNAKVVGISLSCLQRLLSLHIVPQSAAPTVIAAMEECMTQGVDIQLKILQTLLSFVTNFPSIHGSVLGDALILCFKLHESRIAVVSSTAAATLRQLVMFVVDKVVEEDSSESSVADQMTVVVLPDATERSLSLSACDAFSVVQDLCLLANSEKPKFLKLDSLPKTFALELIESVLTNYNSLFRNHPELIALLRHHLCPLLLKLLSDRPIFPLTLRSTRVVFLLLKQFPKELSTESEVFLSLLVKVIGGDTDAPTDSADTSTSYGPRPHWMRVLGMEIIRGLCADTEAMRDIWERFDAESKTSKIFTSLLAMLNRLITEKPAILGIGSQMFGVGISSQSTESVSAAGAGYGFDVGAVAGMVATAASATVSGVVGMIGSEPGLSVAGSSMKLQCIDQLDKADSPPIPEGYIYLLALQCLISICDGFASLAVPLYNSIVVQRPRSSGEATIRAPPAIDFSLLDPGEVSTQQLRTVRDMIENGWPAFLASLSFVAATNLSDELFADVLQSYQNMTNVSGMLGLTTPRDAFLTSLTKFAIPSRVVSSVHSYVEPPTPRSGLSENLGMSASSQPPGLSQRNLMCLKVFISSTLFLAGSLGSYWFNVLEALQNADYVLTGKGLKSMTEKRVNSAPSRTVSGASQMAPVSSTPRHPLLLDADADSVQRAMQRLFDSSKNLEDAAFKDFISALCRLSSEMVGMQSGMIADAESTSLQNDSESIPASADLAHRRRVSGIHLPRTLRTGDFGINKLGGIALQNLHRLTYRSSDIAWNTITSHLLSILHNPLAPHSIRLQAAERLDEIILVVARNLGSAGEIRAEVQKRLLDVLAEQINPKQAVTASSTSTEIKKIGLETLDQLLQSSGHSLVVGWESILEILGSICEPVDKEETSEKHPKANISTSPGPKKRKPVPLGYTNDKGSVALVRIAFHSLTLVCDSMSSLSPDHLRLCITTLGRFGRQMDTNIALTAAGSLMWGVSDSIQAKRKVSEDEPVYSALWVFLLSEVLGLCSDFRAEVRVGAIQTLFRTLQLYGATLSLETWDECLWKIVFPLLDTLTSIIRGASNDASLMIPEEQDAGASWNDSKTLALQSTGTLFGDFLATKIISLPSFREIWNNYLHIIEEAFLIDHPLVSGSALRSLEKALEASNNIGQEFRDLLSFLCEKTWENCDEMGETIIRRARKPISPSLSSGNTDLSTHDQDTFSAFLDVLRVLRTRSLTLTESEWSYEQLSRVIRILKGIITYPHSPVYRPDIDVPTPVQSVAFTVMMDIDLRVSGSPAIVLRDLSEYLTLPFMAAFDVQEMQKNDVRDSPRAKSSNKRVTYIGLAKKVMPTLVEQFIRFKEDSRLYEDETFEAIVSAFSIPIKMKYECPPASKYGSDPPLWKTATTCFLKIIKEAAAQLETLGQSLSDSRIESIWRQVIDVYSGAILADCSMVQSLPQEEQETEELFDLSIVASLEADIIPLLGEIRIPDHVITQLAKVLHQGSRLYDKESEESEYQSNVHSPGGAKSTEQVWMGTTYNAQLLPRERFSYWCFDLLFLICSEVVEDHERSRRRVAALSLTSLLNRCRTVLWGFIADEAIRGHYPFPRAREEEIIYVLRKLLSLRLWPGSLWAAFSDSPSQYFENQPPIDAQLPLNTMIADGTKRSPKAHLFHFYTVFCQILSLPRSLPSSWASNNQNDGTAVNVRSPDVQSLNTVSTSNDLKEEHSVRQLVYLCLLELGKDIEV